MKKNAYVSVYVRITCHIVAWATVCGATLTFPEKTWSSVTCPRIHACGSFKEDRTANTLIRGQWVLPSEQSHLHPLSVSKGRIYCQCLVLLYRICRSPRLDAVKCAKLKKC